MTDDGQWTMDDSTSTGSVTDGRPPDPDGYRDYRETTNRKLFTTLKYKKMKHPKKGQYVWDKHYKKRRRVMSVSQKRRLYFIGADREPVRRHEFIFPLPKKR